VAHSPASGVRLKRKRAVPRVISFIVLLAILLLVAAVFFQVMARFLVPLFLACVLLVVFQPLHAWILKYLPRHPRLAALGTTILILLVVLLPLTWLGWKAYVELYALVKPIIAHASLHELDPPSPLHDTQSAKETIPDASPSGDNTLPPEIKPSAPNWFHEIAFDIRDKLAEATTILIEDDAVIRAVNSIPALLAPLVVTGVQTAVSILIGLAIMVLGLYYFLADGPEMIRAVMYFSPLDERYEQELLERFGDVSRAVVVATLLSAVVQGALAGIGYFIALPHTAPVFLLTALTMATALIPFVGAAAVWVCVCGWIYLYGPRVVDGQTTQGDPLTAFVLAVYCAITVSGIDNVIKPLILHGQSKLHPLLALLSILGGVQVLGPVGIIVGPMLVSFLQALLHMMRRELDVFGGFEGAAVPPLATSPETAAAPPHPQPSSPQALAPHQPAPDGLESIPVPPTPNASNRATKTAGQPRAKRKRGRHRG